MLPRSPQWLEISDYCGIRVCKTLLQTNFVICKQLTHYDIASHAFTLHHEELTNIC